MANPNIKEESEKLDRHNLGQIGPKSEVGKFKSSINAIKDVAKYMEMEKIPNTNVYKSKKIATVVRDAIDIIARDQNLTENQKKDLERVDQTEYYLTWARMRTGVDLEMIPRLEKVIKLIEVGFMAAYQRRMEEDRPIGKMEIKTAQVLADMMSRWHKMKYGDKHININADIAEVQKIMNKTVPDLEEEPKPFTLIKKKKKPLKRMIGENVE